MYLGARMNQAAPLGSEPALLTNIFGSPLVATSYVDASLADGGTAASPYACATDMNWPHGLGCNTPPPLDVNTGGPLLDEAGNPILTKYTGAFSATGTIFHLGPGVAADGSPTPSPIKVTTSNTMSQIASARMDLPLHTDSYDLTSPLLTPSKPYTSFLVPWAPKQPGIGFPIALSGTRNKFISTSNLDLTGLDHARANIDYDDFDPTVVVPDGSVAQHRHQGRRDHRLPRLRSSSARTLTTGDVLAVKMYTPVATALDWINRHPGTVDACGMVIRYSPYNNYPDYITSLNNGVLLGITQGGGFGRVVDVTLFAPGQ